MIGYCYLERSEETGERTSEKDRLTGYLFRPLSPRQSIDIINSLFICHQDITSPDYPLSLFPFISSEKYLCSVRKPKLLHETIENSWTAGLSKGDSVTVLQKCF